MDRFKVRIDLTAKLLRDIKGLTRNQVLVGIPDTAADREPEPGETKPVSNAVIGYVMETGDPALNIPARPSLVPGVESAREEIARRYRTGAAAVMEGKIPDIDVVHTAVGLIAENAVKAKISNGPFVPLSEVTLARRRARGRTSEKPLIDTAQYQRAITHVIRPKG